jgi:hypothetical protein
VENNFTMSWFIKLLIIASLILLGPLGLLDNSEMAREAFVPEMVNCFPGTKTPKFELISLINNWRVRQGLSPLAPDPRLEKAAQLHSLDIATSNICSHDGSNGSSYYQRILAQRYSTPSGELVGCRFPTATSFLNALLADAPHRDILLRTSHRHIGVGLVNNQWAVDFGRATDGPICAGFINRPPVASAGATESGHIDATFNFDGSGSSDPDGNYPLTYSRAILFAPPGSIALRQYDYCGANSANLYEQKQGQK